MEKTNERSPIQFLNLETWKIKRMALILKGKSSSTYTFPLTPQYEGHNLSKYNFDVQANLNLEGFNIIHVDLFLMSIHEHYSKTNPIQNIHLHDPPHEEDTPNSLITGQQRILSQGTPSLLCKNKKNLTTTTLERRNKNWTSVRNKTNP